MDEREARAASILRLLTYLRVILVPIVMWLLLSDPFDYAYGVAAALFKFAARSDSASAAPDADTPYCAHPNLPRSCTVVCIPGDAT